MPKVTIFLPCRNQAEHLPKMLKSIDEQEYRDFELIMFNDRSTDHTEGLMHNFCVKHPYASYWTLTETRNVGEVINKSLKHTKGDYWVWAPADDVFLPTLLSIKEEFSQQHPEAILYHNWWVIDENDKLVGQIDVPPMTPEKLAEVVWKLSPLGFTGIWIPTSILRALPFPTHLQYSEDYYWLIKATIHGYRFMGINQRLHYKRVHSNTTTRRNLKDILANIPHIHAELAAYREARGR